MFYLSFFFIILFILNNIVSLDQSNIDNITSLKTPVLKFKKKIRKRKLINKINKKSKKKLKNIIGNIKAKDNKDKSSSSISNVNIDNTLSSLIGCVLDSEIKYGHIFYYFKNYFNNFINKERQKYQESISGRSEKDKTIKDEEINFKMMNDLFIEVSVFMDLLQALYINEDENNIDINKIQEVIKQNDIELSSQYLSFKEVPYIEDKNYVIEVNHDSLVLMNEYFINNNIEELLSKKKSGSKLNKAENELIWFYDFLYNMQKNRNLMPDKALSMGITIIKQKSTNVINKDMMEYLKDISKRIKNENLLYDIIYTYLYYLLFQAEIISKSAFENTISKTVFNKNNLIEDLKCINESFKDSEKIIGYLWKLINEKRDVYTDNKFHKYIDEVNKVGSIENYFRNYILQNKKKNLSFKEKTLNILPTIGKVVGAAVLVGSAIYAADKMSGKGLIDKGLSSIPNFISDSKNTILNWFSRKTSGEIALRVVASNFVGEGFEVAGQAPINFLGKGLSAGINQYIPYANTVAGSFITSMFVMAAKKEAYSVFTKTILTPIAAKIGFKKYNFNFYDYGKEKIINFFNNINMYYVYKIPDIGINISMKIKDLYFKQSRIQSFIKVVNEKENEVALWIEKAFRAQLMKELEQSQNRE